MTLRSISVCGGILVLALVAAWIISTLPNPPAGPDQRAWHPGEERTETSQTPVDVGAPLEQDGVRLERRVLDVQKHANRSLSARFRGRRIDFRALSALRVTDNVYLAQRKGWTVSEGGLVRLTPWGLLGGDAILIDAPGAAFALIE